MDPWRSTGFNVGEGDLDGPRHRVARDVPFASGCFLLIKREVFENLGPLDERFYLYMEDLEFCRRAVRAGYRIRYEPRAECVHSVHGALGGTLSDPGPSTLYYVTRNRVLYARDYLTGVERPVALGFLLASRGLRALQAAALQGAHRGPGRAARGRAAPGPGAEEEDRQERLRVRGAERRGHVPGLRRHGRRHGQRRTRRPQGSRSRLPDHGSLTEPPEDRRTT